MTANGDRSRRCLWCGKKLARRGSRGPSPSYCNGACRQAAFRARHAPRDPDTPEEWQAAVDGARMCLLIDSAVLYGLVETGLGINVERCEEILERGAGLGHEPRPDEVLIAEWFPVP